MATFDLDNLFRRVEPGTFETIKLSGETFRFPVRIAADVIGSEEDERLERVVDDQGVLEPEEEYWRRVVDVVFGVPAPKKGRPSKEAAAAKEQADKFWELVTVRGADGSGFQWPDVKDIIRFVNGVANGTITPKSGTEPDPKE